MTQPAGQWFLTPNLMGYKEPAMRKPYSNPPGMCNQCQAYGSSATVKLCPLHAQAPAMLTLLREMEENLPAYAGNVDYFVRKISALLATLDGGG